MTDEPYCPDSETVQRAGWHNCGTIFDKCGAPYHCRVCGQHIRQGAGNTCQDCRDYYKCSDGGGILHGQEDKYIKPEYKKSTGTFKRTHHRWGIDVPTVNRRIGFLNRIPKDLNTIKTEP